MRIECFLSIFVCLLFSCVRSEIKESKHQNNTSSEKEEIARKIIKKEAVIGGLAYGYIDSTIHLQVASQIEGDKTSISSSAFEYWVVEANDNYFVKVVKKKGNWYKLIREEGYQGTERDYWVFDEKTKYYSILELLKTKSEVKINSLNYYENPILNSQSSSLPFSPGVHTEQCGVSSFKYIKIADIDSKVWINFSVCCYEKKELHNCSKETSGWLPLYKNNGELNFNLETYEMTMM